MENKDPLGNPIWLQALLFLSSVICVVSFIIIAVMLVHFVHPGPVLTWTFWGSLALVTISFTLWNFGGGRSSL